MAVKWFRFSTERRGRAALVSTRRLAMTLARVAALLALLAVTAGSYSHAQAQQPKVRSQRGFDLRAGIYAWLNANRVHCGLQALGRVCYDYSGLSGARWPRPTPDTYIFNSGLQIAALIPADAGFEWAGDTTGVYLVDGRGGQGAGSPLMGFVDSQNPFDLAEWPSEAVVRRMPPAAGLPDTSVYHDLLLGRSVVSDQDAWVRIWDGDASISGGREHPLGVLVELRAMAFNGPSGNEDIVYLVYTLYNITASDPTVYQHLDPAIRDGIAAIGQRFHDEVITELGVELPAAGYRLEEAYAAVWMDADIGDAGSNYSTASLPFQTSMAYKADFVEQTWRYPPEIFGPPFMPNPGIVGSKFLGTPSQAPLAIFTNFSGSSAGFPEPVGVQQLWRYISGNVTPAAGDNNCTFPNPKERQLCWLYDEQHDTRFQQSTGPFALGPGEFTTFVMAYVHAAPVADALIASGGIGGDLKPLIPFPGDSILNNTCSDLGGAPAPCIRAIDSVAGWVSEADLDGDGSIEGFEIQTVPRSFLHKAQIAQAFFDNGFLTPQPPEPVNFFPVAGDNRVTVVWERSPSEQTGDPFFQIASDPTTPLYDPNFRQFDVEGYRIYRGRSPDALELVAQLDYSGTQFVDHTGAVDHGAECAPELGIVTGCPVDFAGGESHTQTIAGWIVQVRPGWRIEFSPGVTTPIIADTAVGGGASGFPQLWNNGVPFVFVDQGVRNGFVYHYAVTAFDVNSILSGPSSLESGRVTKSIVPRSPATTVVEPILAKSVTGDDGVPLNVEVYGGADRWPRIDPDDGTFDGPVPPVNTGTLSFPSPFVEALPAGDITVRTDSVDRGWAGGFGTAPRLFVTMSAGGTTVQRAIAVTEPTFNSQVPHMGTISEELVPFDSTAMEVLGIELEQDIRMGIEFTWTTTAMAHSSPAVATASGRYGVAGFNGSRYLGHSRWFDEGGTAPADPTIWASAHASRNAGALSGVNWIWAPSAYRSSTSDMDVAFRAVAASGMTAWYPADFTVTWDAGGSITVRDQTHHVDLPFNDAGGSGYGFFTLSGVTATGMDQATFDAEVWDGVGTPAYDVISYQHLYMTEPTCTDWYGIPDYCVTLSSTAEISALDVNRPDGVSNGNGTVLVINGEYFFFGLDALPAAGTQWHLRAIAGRFDADCSPALGPAMTQCSNYTFYPNNLRPSIVPGLSYKITVTQQAGVRADTVGDLASVHTVPDPYYLGNAWEAGTATKVLKFVNLPHQAIIRIYSLSGILVTLIEHNDPTGSGEASWDLRSRNGFIVASGVYFYHVETASGQESIGRFTVVQGVP